MFKNIIHIAFLFVAGVCITACSSGDDDVTSKTTPETPGSKENVVILTGTIGAGEEMTRALGTDGKTVSWKVNDAIAVHYQKDDNTWATVEGKITKVDGDDSKLAKFTAKLTDPKTDSGIGLAYPYSRVLSSTYTTAGETALNFDYSCLSSQDGTTKTITDSKLDLAKTEATDLAITISGGAATLNKNAELKNQVCICKFNLKSSNGAINLYTNSLTIQVGSVATYSLTPPSSISKQSTFYVAMLPTTGNTVTLTANIPNYTSSGSGVIKLDTEEKVNNMNSDDIGKIIAVDKEDGNQAYLCPAAGASPTVSKEFSNATILNKGRFYEKDVLLGTLTPIAVVAYAGEAITNYCSKFIALAINDVPTATTVTLSDGETAVNSWISTHKVKIYNKTYETFFNNKYDLVAPNTDSSSDESWSASNTASSETFSAASGKWRVPSITDWRYVIKGLGDGTSAISPKGVMDYNGVYPGKEDPGYCTPSTTRSNINSACGTSELQSVVYWANSQYLYSTSPDVYKTWRCDFAYGYFVWNSGDDTARIRLVLAW